MAEHHCYATGIIDPTTTILPEFVCPIDGGVLRNAVRSRVCSHQFGLNCIINHLMESESCPVCSTPMDCTKIIPLDDSRDTIQLLPACCPQPRCQWRGPLKDLPNHEKGPQCGNHTVKCMFCEKSFSAGTAFDLHKDVCPEFLAICEYCNEDMKRKYLPAHLKTCEKKKKAAAAADAESKKSLSSASAEKEVLPTASSEEPKKKHVSKKKQKERGHEEQKERDVASAGTELSQKPIESSTTTTGSKPKNGEGRAPTTSGPASEVNQLHPDSNTNERVAATTAPTQNTDAACSTLADDSMYETILSTEESILGKCSHTPGGDGGSCGGTDRSYFDNVQHVSPPVPSTTTTGSSSSSSAAHPPCVFASIGCLRDATGLPHPEHHVELLLKTVVQLTDKCSNLEKRIQFLEGDGKASGAATTGAVTPKPKPLLEVTPAKRTGTTTVLTGGSAARSSGRRDYRGVRVPKLPAKSRKLFAERALNEVGCGSSRKTTAGSSTTPAATSRVRRASMPISEQKHH